MLIFLLVSLLNPSTCKDKNRKSKKKKTEKQKNEKKKKLLISYRTISLTCSSFHLDGLIGSCQQLTFGGPWWSADINKESQTYEKKDYSFIF